ncbi:AraC family transcriptional regulator [Acetobacter sicerae]|uniref:AraC family transcriptional regulator n=1 Tax=Acetobacter sicerae TaxID=85325 RepID=A0ABS8VVF8_9PROT|nr:AraC family transcriptional regulator [Acetobacter sicerae]MCE0742542.1 AraC family transcriptional regulator [Acetobacter sicerae]
MTRLPTQGRSGSPASSTTVLASVVYGLDAFIARLGAQPVDVFSRCGLEGRLSSTPSETVSLDAYCRTLDYAASKTATANFGLWFGHQFAPRRLGMLGYAALSSSSLGDALDNLATFFPIHQDNSIVTHSRQGETARLDYDVGDPLLHDHRQDAELTLAVLCNIIRDACGQNWTPVAVHFRNKAPSCTNEHEKVFGCKVLFGQETNSILFPSASLATPMPAADGLLFSAIKDGLLQIQAHKQSLEQDFLLQVRGVILDLLPHGHPSITQVAERLGCPYWTLQRRLAASGFTHRLLVEDVRRQHALKYLRNGEHSVSQTAFLLGYSEGSAFTRAFTRWHGCSPRSWQGTTGG